jgi:hypothetical protein
MDYRQKYYKDIESHGHVWRIVISQLTDEDLTPMEIGPVLQSLRLVMQGDQADVDTPIVKTSMEMTFIDAPDLEEDRKCGFWEEFYTSSATEYKVQLYKDDILEWSGYITPDSFSEDLRYRGSVSIIARDNLGALQDYMCDATEIADEQGKVEICRLVERGLRDVGIISLDAELHLNNRFSETSRLWPVGFGGGYKEYSDTLIWQVVDADTLSQLNWYEAIEKVLYSIGAVLRYVGENKLVLSTIKDVGLGLVDFWPDVPVRPVSFGAFGRRELAPAVKSIKEEIEFEKPDSDKDNALSVLSYGQQAGLRINRLSMYYNETDNPENTGELIVQGETQTVIHGYTLAKKNGGTVTPQQSRLLDVSRFAKAKGYDSEKYGKWDDPSILYYAIGSPERYPVGPRVAVLSPEYVKLDLSLIVDRPVSFFEQYAVIGNTALTRPIWSGAYPVLLYQIRIEPFQRYYNTTHWYDVENKEWKTSAVDNQKVLPAYYTPEEFLGTMPTSIKLSIEDLTVPFAGRVFFEVVGDANESRLTTKERNYGVFARFKDFKITAKISDDFDFTEKIRTTTNYNDRNNIMLERSPEFGTNAQLGKIAYLCPNTILTKEELYMDGYSTEEYWRWHKDGVTITLPGLIHQQLLAYYAKPNNVLTGELILKGDVPDFHSLWRWGGKDHLLMSGTLNILTGRMENAVLREFMRYDHMWESWAEIENYNLDNRGWELEIRLHTNIEVASDIWGDSLPSWVTPVGHRKISTGLYILDARVMANGTGETRMAYIQLDTALIRITQQG